eukprot:1083250-Pyramimonas_sp.AAC.1
MSRSRSRLGVVEIVAVVAVDFHCTPATFDFYCVPIVFEIYCIPESEPKPEPLPMRSGETR